MTTSATVSTADNPMAATFAQLMQARHAVRAYRPQAVASAVLEQIFRIAQLAPSNCNTQPWQVHVVSGVRLDNLRAQMTANARAGELTLDFPYDAKYAGIYQQRQYAAADAMYSAMQVPRADKAQRQAVFMRNYACFDAPHAVFLFLPEPFGVREAADLGLYAQALMLAMTAHGLGCCPQTSLSFHADLIRRELGIDTAQKLLFGISFGYADPDHPINQARTGRAALADAVSFHN